MAPLPQMVGAVTLFFFPAPLVWKQIYLIITGTNASQGETPVWEPA